MRSVHGASLVLPPLILVVAIGCGGGSGGPAPIDVETPNAERCEILDPDECLLPFPSDALTRPDASMDTGRRVDFVRESMPANASGVHIDPMEWNRNDGFSPGAQIAVLVPGVDPVASGLAPVTDIARSLDPGSNLVLLDADTGERVLAWAELDAHAEDPARRLLLVLPGRSLAEGHRHVVAPGTGRRDSAAIAPSEVFRVLRDAVPTTNPAIGSPPRHGAGLPRPRGDRRPARRPLPRLGFHRRRARETPSERLLHIRDDGFAALGDGAPAFTV